jgi:alkylated DNA repair dioxygenase AlkB
MENQDYHYYPGLCASVSYTDILRQIEPHLLKTNDIRSKGRFSFVITSEGEHPYPHYHQATFEEIPIIQRIRDYITLTFSTQFDYCLVHLYLDGNAGIAWHNDKEALQSTVVSVSFGATREFRLRNMGQTDGWISSYKLNSGDLFIMGPDCQKKYEHTIVKCRLITEARINLTFRQRNVKVDSDH